MVKKYVRVNRIDEEFISLDEYLEYYHSKIVDSWWEIQDYVNAAFNNSNECEAFLKYLPKFNPDKMHSFYERIKVELDFFDDDILRYIAFIAALGYFEKIGNPSLDVWVNAVDINRPFNQTEERHNILDLIGLKYGGNAIRNGLLSAWKIVLY